MLEESVRMRRAVCGTKPHKELAVKLLELARVREARGDMEAGATSLRQSLTTERVGVRGPKLASEEVAVPLHEPGRVYVSQGDREAGATLLVLLVFIAVVWAAAHCSTLE